MIFPAFALDIIIVTAAFEPHLSSLFSEGRIQMFLRPIYASTIPHRKLTAGLRFVTISSQVQHNLLLGQQVVAARHLS